MSELLLSSLNFYLFFLSIKILYAHTYLKNTRPKPYYNSLNTAAPRISGTSTGSTPSHGSMPLARISRIGFAALFRSNFRLASGISIIRERGLPFTS